MCRQDEAGFPQKQLETAFLHSLRLLEQNREYLQMHLQPLKDARTAQALEDMEQEAARLERTFRELMELSAPEEPVQKRPVDLCRLLAQLEGLRGEIDAQSSTKLTVDWGWSSALSGATGKWPNRSASTCFRTPCVPPRPAGTSRCACGRPGRTSA